MSIRFRCPNCDALLATSTGTPGSIIACARCHKNLIVPEPLPTVASLDFRQIDEEPVEPTEADRFVIIDPELAPDPHPCAYASKPEYVHAAHVAWWRNPVIIFGWGTPLLCLAAFLCYILPSRTTVDGKRKPPQRANEPVASNLRSDLAPSSKASPATSPKPSPPRVVTALAEDDANADTAADVDADPAPPPNPAIPPIAKPAENAGNTFNLRGATPKVGFKVRERTKARGARTNSFAKPRSKTVSVRTDYLWETEKVYTVEDVVGDEVCRYLTKVITGDITFHSVDATGKKRNSEELDHFVGETIRSVKIGGKWNHGLLERLPNDQTELAALADMIPWFDRRTFAPPERLKPGASWEVDQSHIDALLRTNMTAVSGKILATFLRVGQLEDQPCAVIQYTGKLRGRVDLGEHEESIGSLVLDMTTVRSLTSGIDLKTDGAVEIRSNRTATVDNTEVAVTVLARITIATQAAVEN
jgi:hypothetical protein